MTFDHIANYIKKGYRASRIFWRTQSIGCIKENDNVYLFNRINGVLKKGNIWCQSYDDDKNDWCVSIPFKMSHLKKLGFSDIIYNNKHKINKFCDGVVIKKMKNDWFVKSNFVDNIYYLHEFINFCFLNNISIDIDITKDCLLDLKYSKLELVNKPNIIEWIEPQWHWKK